MLCGLEKRVRSCFEPLGGLLETMAGPLCLTLAPTLILIGIICFCECIWRSLRRNFTHTAIVDVIAPSLSYPIISIPICLLITLNLCMHYLYVITVSPGFLDDPPHDSGNNFLWVGNWDKGKKTMMPRIRGTSWSEKGVKITPASKTKCQKCKKFRPEVSLIFFTSHAKLK